MFYVAPPLDKSQDEVEHIEPFPLKENSKDNYDYDLMSLESNLKAIILYQSLSRLRVGNLGEMKSISCMERR